MRASFFDMIFDFDFIVKHKKLYKNVEIFNRQYIVFEYRAIPYMVVFIINYSLNLRFANKYIYVFKLYFSLDFFKFYQIIPLFAYPLSLHSLHLKL